MTSSYENVQNQLLKEIFQQAEAAANAAGEVWLKNAKPKYEFFNEDLDGKRQGPGTPVLDVVGGAYLEMKDKRTVNYKLLKRNGLIRPGGEERTIIAKHKFVGRSERGLKVAIMNAFAEVLKSYGIDGFSVKSFID